MNAFAVLKCVQRDYRKYVESFQLIKSDDIPPVLEEAIERGELLWKEPFVQASRQSSAKANRYSRARGFGGPALNLIGTLTHGQIEARPQVLLVNKGFGEEAPQIGPQAYIEQEY